MPDDIPNLILLTGALGVASFGLVDASKAFGGGISNAGFIFIDQAIAPFSEALKKSGLEAYEILRANWLNGVDRGEQKAKAKALIRLALTSADVADIVKALEESGNQQTLATTLRQSTAALTSTDNPGEAGNLILGRLDAIMDARLDAAFERADQRYRNWAKGLAALLAIFLALTVSFERGQTPFLAYVGTKEFWSAFFIGLAAVPLAPIAKDLATTINSAVSAVGALKR